MSVATDKNQLVKICKHLQKASVKLSNKQDDGRINSILNESEVLKLIEQKFEIGIHKTRDWADFYIDDTPVNIKITTTKTADNASSKKGLYYALTGEIYTGNGQWDNYLKSLKDNIKDTEKDYYFLVINIYSIFAYNSAYFCNSVIIFCCNFFKLGSIIFWSCKY